MLIVILVGAMLSFQRPEPWGSPESIEAGKSAAARRPLGPRRRIGSQRFGLLRSRQEKVAEESAGSGFARGCVRVVTPKVGRPPKGRFRWQAEANALHPHGSGGSSW